MPMIGVLPLRGGSKGVPKKNKRDFHGKPLFFWVLGELIKFLGAPRCIVSTDDEEIMQLVITDFPGVQVIVRPTELATDAASTESAVMHVIDSLPYSVSDVILAQATSPFTTAEDFANAAKIFKSENLDSLLSVVSQKRFFWHKHGVPMNYDASRRPRRQEFDGWLMENGAIYISKASLYRDYGNRLGGRIGLYEMDHWSSDEIDEEIDWAIVEAKFKLAGRV